MYATFQTAPCTLLETAVSAEKIPIAGGCSSIFDNVSAPNCQVTSAPQYTFYTTACTRYVKQLQSGTVVEEGTHTELYSQATSVYHSLVELQAQAMDKRADANCGGSVADADAPLPAPEPSHAGSVLPLVSSRRDSLRRPSKPPGAADVTAAGKKDDELVRLRA